MWIARRRASVCRTTRPGTALVSPRSFAAVRPSTSIRGGRPAGETVPAGTVVEAAVDPAERPGRRESLQRLVDGRTGSEVEEIDRGPHVRRLPTRNAVGDLHR